MPKPTLARVSLKSISEAGARGQLDELETAVRSGAGVDIQKKETDQGFDTRKVIQYARLLMPPEVSGNSSVAEMLRAYKNPEQCLTDFSRWFDNRKTDPNRVYLTGLSMGGMGTWSMAVTYPERWAAIAPAPTRCSSPT